MKDFLSKKQYSRKIDTLMMKSSAYTHPTFYRHPPPAMIFQISHPL